MPASAWTYSDWITYARGDPLRVQRLRLHVQEVADKLSTSQSYSTGSGFSVTHRDLSAYLASLQKQEIEETKIAATVAGTRVGWSRAKTFRSGWGRGSDCP